MLKKLLKLLSLYQGTRHGHHRYGSSYKPWKQKKWRGHGYPPHQPPHGYGYDHGPYDHTRPRGLKGVVIDAIVRKLLKHR